MAFNAATSSSSGNVSVTVLDITADAVASSASGSVSVTVLVNSTPSRKAVALNRTVSSKDSEVLIIVDSASSSENDSVTILTKTVLLAYWTSFPNLNSRS